MSRNPLIRRIGPSIAVMKIKHQGKSLILDTLAKTHHIVYVLTHLCICSSVRIDSLRIHEKADPLSIPANLLTLHILKHIINLITISIVIRNLFIIITLQHRYISSKVHSFDFRTFLGLRNICRRDRVIIITCC